MQTALIMQVALFLFHQMTTLLDLFPFNGVRFTQKKERLLEAMVDLVLMALPPIAFGFRLEPLMRFGVAYYFILFAVECATWRAPYLFGASEKWLEIYERVHSKTLTPFPRRGARPVPNLEHLILMALTLLVALVTLREFKAVHPDPFQHVRIAWAIGVALTAGTASQFVGRARIPQSGVSRG
jgi:hypothetical protein